MLVDMSLMSRTLPATSCHAPIAKHVEAVNNSMFGTVE